METQQEIKREMAEFGEHGALWDWFAARAHGPHAIAWLMGISFLEPIILPLVPESLMVAMILAGREKWKKYVALSAIFSFLGGLTGYFLGVLLFHLFGASILSALGLHRWFGIVRRMLNGNIFIVMLLVTFTPIPDKAFVLLAGFFRVQLIPYALGFLVGRLLRFGIVGYLVHRFGGHILNLVRRYFEWLAVGVVIVFAYAVGHFFHVLPF